MRVAWGRRKHDPVIQSSRLISAPLASPALAIAENAAETEEDLRQPTSFRPMEVYTSLDEALMAKEARRMRRVLQPIPYVIRLANGGRTSI